MAEDLNKILQFQVKYGLEIIWKVVWSDCSYLNGTARIQFPHTV